MKKIANVLVDVLIVLMLVVSVLVIIMSVSSRKDGVPNLFGYAFLSVASDSMEPEFMAGDLIVSDVNGKESYEAGDIVTFMMTVENTQIMNTHRIVDVQEIDGIRYYHTRGDNAEGEDRVVLSASDIIGIYTGTRVPGVGKALDFLKTKLGFFVCMVLPMIVFFLWELYCFIRNLMAYNNEKAMAAAESRAAELTEEVKRKAIEEYLAAQEQKKQTDNENES